MIKQVFGLTRHLEIYQRRTRGSQVTGVRFVDDGRIIFSWLLRYQNYSVRVLVCKDNIETVLICFEHSFEATLPSTVQFPKMQFFKIGFVSNTPLHAFVWTHNFYSIFLFFALSWTAWKAKCPLLFIICKILYRVKKIKYWFWPIILVLI